MVTVIGITSLTNTLINFLALPVLLTQKQAQILLKVITTVTLWPKSRLKLHALYVCQEKKFFQVCTL